MRVMLMIKGIRNRGGASEEPLAAMGSYNDELKQAGVLLDLAGLLPSVDIFSDLPGEYGVESQIEIQHTGQVHGAG